MSESSYDKISDALETTFKSKEIVKKEVKEISVSDEDRFKKDFSDVRTNIRELIDTGKDAIDGILKVATEGDAPRAYEVVSQLLKTVSEMNHDLIDLHKKTKDITKEETVNNTHNSIYVGSTSDLQDLINSSRSRKKVIQNENVIDHDDET
tara:strand:- start:40308 stop:40760 length:453 start_codon:yes stop_codon:yes gene_type:complete